MPTIPLPALNYRNQPNDIWSAELNVRPPKVDICIPDSPRLLDSPQELGAGSCTFEAKQYSAYRFRLPPTPDMRLVQSNPRSAQPTTERYLINTDGATHPPLGLPSTTFHLEFNTHVLNINTSYISRVIGYHSTSTEPY